MNLSNSNKFVMFNHLICMHKSHTIDNSIQINSLTTLVIDVVTTGKGDEELRTHGSGRDGATLGKYKALHGYKA